MSTQISAAAPIDCNWVGSGREVDGVSDRTTLPCVPPDGVEHPGGPGPPACEGRRAAGGQGSAAVGGGPPHPAAERAAARTGVPQPAAR